jgi:PAS domain S-box-containing protein
MQKHLIEGIEIHEIFKQLVENFPNGTIFMVNREMKCLLAGGNLLKQLGISTSYFENKYIHEIFEKEKVDFLIANYEKVFNGELVNFETENIVSQDKVRRHNTFGVPLLYNNEIVASIWITQEITELREMQMELTEKEELFRQLAENIFDIFYMRDAQYAKMIYVSPAVKEIMGITPEDIYAQPSLPLQMIHKDDVEFIKQTINLSNQVNTSANYRLVRPDGQIRWLWNRAFPVRDKNGKVYRVAGIVEDITDRRLAEDKLNETLKALEEKNYELDNYVYKVSHDLRSPIASIIGLLNLMKMEEHNAKISEYIHHLENRLGRLDDFIKSILSHSKAVNAKVLKEKVFLIKLINSSLDELKYMPNYDKLQIKIEVEEDLQLESDPLRLSIVLKNLLSNAVKYQNPYIAERQLLIKAITDKSLVHIIIKDNGIGIKQEYLPHLFDMFFRATDHSEGSGLGLYIVKQTLKHIGGTIQVDSEYSKGTTFHIRLGYTS